jgi:hypothetical protein
MDDMPNEDELEQALLDAARATGFVEFDTIGDLPGVLKHLGPVTGGDVLVFRGGDYTEPQRSEITEAVLHYYVEVARNKLPHRIDGKPAWPLPTDRVAAHVPLLVFLPEGADVEHLDESDMLRAGWARVPEETL